MAGPHELLEVALECSKADECVVIATVSSTANLRWANNTLTTNGLSNSTLMTVISIVDGAEGRAASVLTEDASTTAQVRRLVERADEAARGAPPADDAGPLATGDTSNDFADEPVQTNVDTFGGLSADLGEAFRQARTGDRLLFGYVEHDVTTTYVASSTGLRLRHVQPTAQIGMTGKPHDLSTSAWVGDAADQVDELDVPTLTGELHRRIGWGLTRVDLPAGRYDTILPPTAVADLMIYAYYVMGGREASEGRTVFSDLSDGTSVGKQVARPTVRLHSDPRLPGLAAAPFVIAHASGPNTSVFDNGLPIIATDWISDGILRALHTSRYSATRTGLEHTPQIDNLRLSISGGTGSTDDLVGRSDRSLLLTCLWYIREVDPQTLLLTGLTRDGVYLVEGGEVVGAVNNFRFNESPVDLLGRFTDAGETVRSYSREWGDFFPCTATPALRVPDFNMSTVSKAS